MTNQSLQLSFLTQLLVPVANMLVLISENISKSYGSFSIKPKTPKYLMKTSFLRKLLLFLNNQIVMTVVFMLQSL